MTAYELGVLLESESPHSEVTLLLDYRRGTKFGLQRAQD